MTPLAVSILGSVASFALVLVVLDLIRRRRLRERYALLWLLTGIVLTALSAWRGGLNTIARWLGVRGYPPAVLFARRLEVSATATEGPRQIWSGGQAATCGQDGLAERLP